MSKPLYHCPSVDDPWIESRLQRPTLTDGHVWVVIGNNSTPGQRIGLLAASYVASLPDSYTHWKRSGLAIPLLPGEEPAVIIPDAILAAWRELNPDYAPDDVPPDSFVHGFELAKAKDGDERKAALRRIIERSS